jgi:hypothetical protein
MHNSSAVPLRLVKPLHQFHSLISAGARRDVVDRIMLHLADLLIMVFLPVTKKKFIQCCFDRGGVEAERPGKRMTLDE